jgi:hypothetical protein
VTVCLSGVSVADAWLYEVSPAVAVEPHAAASVTRTSMTTKSTMRPSASGTL